MQQGHVTTTGERGTRVAAVAAACLLAVATGATGCVVDPAQEGAWDQSRLPIVGGESEQGFRHVGSIRVRDPVLGDRLACSATAVTPTVLLTAAHCMVPGAIPWVAPFTTGDTLDFETEDAAGDTVTAELDLESRVLAPQWDKSFSLPSGDLALVGLVDPVDLGPHPRLRSEPLAAADIGTRVTAIGYGLAGGPGTDGERRSVEMIVSANAGGYYSLRHPEPEDWRGLCHGDSGGASVIPGESRDTIYGVHSAAIEEGCGAGADASIAPLYERFVRSTILELDPDAALCGDGVCTAIESEEECPRDCVPAGCGDAVLGPAEVCDDGNTAAGDGCSAACGSDESCGNGTIDLAVGETCDDGNAEDGDGCSALCRYEPACGNGIVDVDAGEGCDDGNVEEGDGCTASCHLLTCGDGVVDPDLGEECDDGDAEDGDRCSETCRILEPEPGCSCRAGAPQPASLRLASLLRLL